jgi:hypothetical protein
MLLLLHGPKKQRLPLACLFPSFPDVLLLLLVLNKVLAFVALKSKFSLSASP